VKHIVSQSPPSSLTPSLSTSHLILMTHCTTDVSPASLPHQTPDHGVIHSACSNLFTVYEVYPQHSLLEVLPISAKDVDAPCARFEVISWPAYLVRAGTAKMTASRCRKCNSVVSPGCRPFDQVWQVPTVHVCVNSVARRLAARSTWRPIG